MHRETLTYQADGLTMKGELFAPDGGGARAGVLVFPEAFGLSEHAIGRAQRLAEAGHVALACDLHGDAKLIDDLEAAIGAIKPLMAEPTRIRERSGKALDALLATGTVDAGKDRRHRLLLRRHDGAGAGPLRGRHQGGGGLPLGPRHRRCRRQRARSRAACWSASAPTTR